MNNKNSKQLGIICAVLVLIGSIIATVFGLIMGSVPHRAEWFIVLSLLLNVGFAVILIIGKSNVEKYLWMAQTALFGIHFFIRLLSKKHFSFTLTDLVSLLVFIAIVFVLIALTEKVKKKTCKVLCIGSFVIVIISLILDIVIWGGDYLFEIVPYYMQFMFFLPFAFYVEINDSKMSFKKEEKYTEPIIAQRSTEDAQEEIEKLYKLKTMLDKGYITQDEFEKKKNQIIQND